MSFPQREIQNRQPWRKALQRFTQGGAASFRNWVGQVVPVVQMGRELPDRERIQWGVFTGVATQANGASTQVPACGLNSTRDIKLERVYWTAYVTSSVAFDRQNVVYTTLNAGFGFATSLWNPFNATSAIVEPQVRPDLLPSAVLSPGTTRGIEGSGTTAPPPAAIAHKQMPKFDNNFSGGVINTNLMDFGPDGLLLPAFTTFAISHDRHFITTGQFFYNLEASWVYRELD